MIRAQRKAHLRVWTGIALLLPLSLAVILALASSEVAERAPQRLETPTGDAG